MEIRNHIWQILFFKIFHAKWLQFANNTDFQGKNYFANTRDFQFYHCSKCLQNKYPFILFALVYKQFKPGVLANAPKFFRIDAYFWCLTLLYKDELDLNWCSM